MFDFSIFCHLLRLMGIYRVGAPVWEFEKFRSLFSFLLVLFLSFLSFIFFFFLSLGGPLSSGDPGHCPPMPPSRYATVWNKSQCTCVLLVMELGLICYMDSWVAHNTFWEQIIKINKLIAYINCNTALLCIY